MSDTVPPRSSGNQAESLGFSGKQYQQLKKIAWARLNGQQPGATLNCTALVHEAYVKLQLGDIDPPANDEHYLALASLAMRQIIVDHVRKNNTHKRGGNELHVTLQESLISDHENTIDLIELDEALTRLGALDEELEKLVVLRFFGGLSMVEAASMLGKSKRTLERDWSRARMHLYRDLIQDDH